MFKISKLEARENEKVNIYLSELIENNIKTNSNLKYNVLNFEISDKNYSFEFMIDYKINEYLNLPYGETIIFNDYVVETWLNVNDLNGVEPIVDVKITRYIDNKFIMFVVFYTEFNYKEDDYAGMIEVVFNLDEYINK